MAAPEVPVAVVGGGVVGCAVAHALARRGVETVLLEAEPGLALGASGANSGILHTGFDSMPGELETRLILRSAAIREEVLWELGVAVWRCGARLRPRDEQERAAVARLAENARANEVDASLEADGTLRVPGEAVTDPVAFVHALASAARAGGARIQLGARVIGIETADGAIQVKTADGESVRARGLVNCAGLFADDLAEMAGEHPVTVYPRKGEFLVFDAPPGPPLQEILLPVPSALGKGVLVFPALDGHVIAGPTARERTDKEDWSVEADAAELLLPRARRMWHALEGREPVDAYAGLRPAGRDANYVIERSRTLPGMIHVAAIRSTGLSASPAIGEYVVEMLVEDGSIHPDPLGERRLAVPSSAGARPWWQRGARHHRAQTGETT